MSDDDFFIGWSPNTPRADRRFLIGAGLGLVGAAAIAGVGLGMRGPQPGPGAWRQSDMRVYRGLLKRAPYPMLRFRDEAGALRTALLAGYGKDALVIPHAITDAAIVCASAIVRGPNLMLAVPAEAGAIEPWRPDQPITDGDSRDEGEGLLVGEIVDAKCFFGAMRPGYGKTHKSCAALCIEGRLPLAFCSSGECGSARGETPLLLNSCGLAHGRDLLPFVADPVIATGRFVRIGGLLTFRADAAEIRRL
jgi:hypothetical protein